MLMLTFGLDDAEWTFRILEGEKRQTGAVRQKQASGSTGLGLPGQRCDAGHCVAQGSHAAVMQWMGTRITGDHRTGFELRQGAVPDAARSKAGERIPDSLQCIQESVLHSR